MTAPCPHCGAPHDLAHRLNGDQVYCSCGGWFRVWFRVAFAPGGVQLTKCDPPVSFPKESKKARG